MISTDDFDYTLDPALIAQNPVTPRDHSKLMVLSRADHSLNHHTFSELPNFLHRGDALVINDTSVIAVRLIGTKIPSGGRIECFLIRQISPNTWETFLRGKVHVGQQLQFQDEVTATVSAINPDTARRLVTFEQPHNIHDQLSSIGLPPLPPYIKRAPTQDDIERYQTVYAKVPGAIAAPTAGLHFTPNLLENLRHAGVTILSITLHTGLGTFLSVMTDDITDHKMDPEWFSIDSETCQTLARIRAEGGRVVAVGTTTVKALETAGQGETLRPQEGETALFIYPGFQFHAVDAMITNFHLPKTTLLMLVCAFADKEFVLQAYQEAINHDYRFYSYGDAMLIL